MDKNNIIGLTLMMVMLAVYFQFFSPEPPVSEIIDNPVVDNSPSNLSEKVNNEVALNLPLDPSDSSLTQLNTLKYGLFASKIAGEESIISLTTEELEVTFTNKGGTFKNVEIKNYTTYDSLPLHLFNENHAIDIYFEHLSKSISLKDLIFESELIKYSDSTVLVYSLDLNGKRLRQIYTLYDQGFVINYRMENDGFDELIDTKNLNFYWEGKMPKIERELLDARQRATTRYYSISGNTDYISKTSTEYEEMPIDEPVKWLAFNQKFFTASVIAENSFSKGLITLTPSNDDQIVKQGALSSEIPFTDFVNNQAQFKFFFGPNKYSILNEVTEGFSQNIELGWVFLPFINKYLIIPIFNFLERFMSNYGLIIIIMVLIIRVILSPLTYKSHISMAKMRVLKPELDAIKEKHDGDMQKAQSDQMELYRKAGINPLSGCIPVLLQFPILVSLFYFIPSAIELRLESFLWADDLSSYDSILSLPFNIPFYGDHVSLFTLLMAGSTILYTMANSQMTTIQGPMKTMQYLMPIMFLFFFNSYPSGLSYYYFITNLVSFGQIALFRKFVNEDKIKLIMEENKKKNVNKKKSKFQSRLEDAMKANQTAQKNKGKKK
ncbi:MAG: membrane protein insertase YidC [Cyclobacteriaceae bacterium]|jgi:YidC/Oxa1 family membrane protein insertase|nr:membrane protein insertase YidC [Cyclobacteriaceae bacterium]|tara:strand:+ start:2852 stop:4672 length:1821 start_codon:yes stop_codon:yes gene_type:complete